MCVCVLCVCVCVCVCRLLSQVYQSTQCKRSSHTLAQLQQN